MTDDIKRLAKGLAVSALALILLIASIFRGPEVLDDEKKPAKKPIDKPGE